MKTENGDAEDIHRRRKWGSGMVALIAVMRAGEQSPLQPSQYLCKHDI